MLKTDWYKNVNPNLDRLAQILGMGQKPSHGYTIAEKAPEVVTAPGVYFPAEKGEVIPLRSRQGGGEVDPKEKQWLGSTFQGSPLSPFASERKIPPGFTTAFQGSPLTPFGNEQTRPPVYSSPSSPNSPSPIPPPPVPEDPFKDWEGNRRNRRPAWEPLTTMFSREKGGSVSPPSSKDNESRKLDILESIIASIKPAGLESRSLMGLVVPPEPLKIEQSKYDILKQAISILKPPVQQKSPSGEKSSETKTPSSKSPSPNTGVNLPQPPTLPQVPTSMEGIPTPQSIQPEIRTDSPKINPMSENLVNLATPMFPRDKGGGVIPDDPYLKWKVTHPYQDLITEAAKTHNVPEELLHSVMYQESRGVPTATGKAGEVGLMQLMPETVQQLGLRNPTDPKENIMGGAKWLSTRPGETMPEKLVGYKGRGPSANQYVADVMGRTGMTTLQNTITPTVTPEESTRNAIENIQQKVELQDKGLLPWGETPGTMAKTQEQINIDQATRDYNAGKESEVTLPSGERMLYDATAGKWYPANWKTEVIRGTPYSGAGWMKTPTGPVEVPGGTHTIATEGGETLTPEYLKRWGLGGTTGKNLPPIAHLINYRDSLDPNDPNRKIVEAEINKATEKTPTEWGLIQQAQEKGPNGKPTANAIKAQGTLDSQAKRKQTTELGGIPPLSEDTAPRIAQTPTGPRDESALDGLTEDQKGIIRGLVDYKYPWPGSFAMSRPKMQALIGRAERYNPDFSGAEYQVRQNIRKSFTSGKEKDNILALNTATGHIDSLVKASNDLANSNWVTGNAAVNLLAKYFPVSEDLVKRQGKVASIETKFNAVADELATIFKRSGATDTSIKQWREIIKNAASATPEMWKGFIGGALELMGSRIEALRDVYESGMGQWKDFPILSENSRKILGGMGMDVDKIDRVAGGEPTQKSVEIIPRKPGENIADYLKRTGGK